MRKRRDRKAFTIVELVIVIAVIGILATVLVPTFGDVIQKAQDSKAMQAAKNAYTAYIIEQNGTAAEHMVYELDGKFVALHNGAAVGVYASKEAAVQAMIDDPDMRKLTATTDEKLFAYDDNSSGNDWDTDGDGVLEILAIGNSFSVDALQYAYQIAQSLGIEEIVIGNLYIGGCTLQTHAANATGDLSKYTYYYNDSGTWSSTGSYKISTALESRSWDYVSMQQGSPVSGVESSYNADLTNLIAYVQDRSDAKLVWHMTWAYQQNSTHSAFPTYNKDQMTMYNAIVSAVQNKIVTNGEIDLIVPNGTAVQNSRTSLLGDTTTRDGYHMSYDYGRYLTGLLFIKTVTGLSIDDIAYAPSGVDGEEKAIAIESANNAAAKPFEVTRSAFAKVEPENPDEGYILLKPVLHKGAYWHSIEASHYNTLVTDASNSKYFFATSRFTPETLPVGSIIILADGWQYRPEGWVTDTVQSSRADTTTASYVVVTEEWWGDYTIRAFNIAKVGTPSLINLSEEPIREAFRIYVPEEKHTHTYESGICTGCGEAQ